MEPPDSQYSRITAKTISTASERWIVEVEGVHPTTGFYSFNPLTRKQHGPYEMRKRAVAMGIWIYVLIIQQSGKCIGTRLTRNMPM